MQTQDHFGTATSINKTCLRARICLHINSNGGYTKVLFRLSLLRGTHKSESFTADVWWLLSLPSPPSSDHSPSLKLSEFSSMGAAAAGPKGVRLSVIFFVHNVWQVVAWDTCSRIHLQGLVVYEKHPSQILGKVHPAAGLFTALMSLNPI